MQPPPPPPPPPPQPNNQPPSMYHPGRIEEGGHSPEKPEATGLVFVLNCTHNFTQISLGGVIVSALIISNLADFTDSLAQHIILCTVGYFILMAQAILSFSPFGWANNLQFESKRNIHLSMQILGALLAITGSAIRFADTDISTFETNHGIFGFIAMLLTSVSLVGGVLNLIFPKQLDSKVSRILHSCLGTVTISFAFLALIFAFHLHYREVAGDANANSSILLSMFALVGIVLMAMIKNVKRILD